MFSRASNWISKTLTSQNQNENNGEQSAAAINNVPLTPPTTPTMSQYKHYTMPIPNQVTTATTTETIMTCQNNEKVIKDNNKHNNINKQVSSKIISKKNENIRRISNNKKSKKGIVYHCPYKWCKKPIYNQAKSFFNHIRKDHYSGFPPFLPPKNCIFQNVNGDSIEFNERSHHTLSDGQEIYSKDLKIRYYCPYKNCIESNYCRQHLFSHIRNIHDQDFPEFKEFNRLAFKNTLTKQMIRLDEKSRNCLNDKESITIIKVSKKEDPDLYYCPFQECEYGEGLLYFSDLYKHIRREHECMETLPQRQKLAVLTKQFHLTKNSGQLLDLSDSNCKNTLDSNDMIHIQYD
ncbi:hypothetical protein BDC45DRAFT_528477 [Circinella umbellata]|nr:hypothetical protein BDC45DRAFT_528477 [Circinella umbellata]